MATDRQVEKAAGSTLAAIPTHTLGYQFRSRLEAKWARMFTGLGWRWEYEPLDLGGWIPDFLLHTSTVPVLVEIKPEPVLDRLHRYVPKIRAALPTTAEVVDEDGCTARRFEYEVLLLGCTPFPFDREHDVVGPPLGLLGDEYDAWDAAEWMTCSNCGAISFFHSVQSYRSRICGCYDGDHYLGKPPLEHLERLWADACNATQWRAPR